MTDTKNIQLNT